MSELQDITPKHLREVADRLEFAWEPGFIQIRAAAERIEELENENAELRKDKARLDYLETRDDTWLWRGYDCNHLWSLGSPEHPSDVCVDADREPSVRAAIDAARGGAR
jgi:hypothetical protein